MMLCCLPALLIVGCVNQRAATIQHVVLIKLNDPAQASALLEDCDRDLSGLGCVVEYWSGLPDQSGRVSEAIDTDWDAALCVGYIDADAYLTYVDHPAHVALVQRWKPRMTWLRIHDVAVSDDN